MHEVVFELDPSQRVLHIRGHTSVGRLLELRDCAMGGIWGSIQLGVPVIVLDSQQDTQ